MFVDVRVSFFLKIFRQQSQPETVNFEVWQKFYCCSFNMARIQKCSVQLTSVDCAYFGRFIIL